MGVSQELEQSRKIWSLGEERTSVKCSKRLIRVFACLINRATVSVSIQESAKYRRKSVKIGRENYTVKPPCLLTNSFAGKVSKKVCEDWPRKLLQNLPNYRLAMREPKDSFVNQPKDCNEKKLVFWSENFNSLFWLFCLSVKLCVKQLPFLMGL